MKKPIAHIAVNNNRLKQYGNAVYLKDGTNFQIELNNPTMHRYLAKISHNGRKENTELILKPGQHSYINRFLDNDKKLTFKTYQVPQENLPEAEKSNGKVTVTFHKEKPNEPDLNIYTDPQPPNWWGGHTGNPGGFPDLTTTFSAGTSNVTLKSNVRSSLKQAETGRIEKGDKSEQSFNYGTGEFYSAYQAKSELQIKPESRKPQSAPIRQYCPECGSKVKQRWKYCTVCGDKI